MPELPEVETIRRTLESSIKENTITNMTVLNPGTVDRMTASDLHGKVVNRQITSLHRRGKYLVLILEDDGRLVIDLRMTGRLIVRSKDNPGINRHTRLIIFFDGEQLLRFDDQRKFGRVIWFSDEPSMEARLNLGPEPIDPVFDADQLEKIVDRRKRSIKSLLLDQKLISGIGNIYADEALFRANIAPSRQAGALKRCEIEDLATACRYVLEQGIKHRGTTLRDYVDGDGRKGQFGEYLKVYGREGKSCYVCDEPIVRVTITGRSSSYCPKCQS